MSERFRLAAAEPTPEAVARVVARVLQPVAPPAAAALPTDESIRRVRAKVGARRRREAPPVHRRVLPWAAGVAVAALALWGVKATPVDRPLRADVLTPATLTPEVQLRYEGDGDVVGTRRDLLIHWQIGQIGLDVEPDRGIQLVVVTDEGRVTVKGTAFAVERSALGTRVTVERGAVGVACAGGLPRTLVAGDVAECLPVRAAGMLARARALRGGGAAPPVVLQALDAGLALTGPTDPVRGELLAERLDLLVAAGALAEAGQVAEAYLEGGFPTRRDEVLEIATMIKNSGSRPGAAASLSSEER